MATTERVGRHRRWFGRSEIDAIFEVTRQAQYDKTLHFSTVGRGPRRLPCARSGETIRPNPTMSTDLYGIRLLARDGATLMVRVINVYADVPQLPNPALPGFFLSVLAEAGVVLGEELERGRAEPGVARVSSRVLREVVITETANVPGRIEPTFHAHRGEGWAHECELPQATYAVTVARPELLARVVIGRSWGTTAYEVGPDYPGAALEPAALAALVSDALNAGLNGGTVSEACLAALIDGLSDPEGTHTYPIAEALAYLGPSARAAVPRLCQLVDANYPDTAALVRHALGAIGDPRATSTALAMLANTERAGTLRADASSILGGIGPAAARSLDALRRTEPSPARDFALLRVGGDTEAGERFFRAASDTETGPDLDRLVPLFGDALPTYLHRLPAIPGGDFYVDQALAVLTRCRLSAGHPGVVRVRDELFAWCKELEDGGVAPEEWLVRAECADALVRGETAAQWRSGTLA